MAYNWAQLAFVEKWRLSAVRGQVVGMARPRDKTCFDLRLHPGEGNVGQIPGHGEIHLVDAGDLIREKRFVLMDRLAVIVRAIPSGLQPAGGAAPALQPPDRARSRRVLEPGSRAVGKLVRLEADVALVDVGFPVLLALPEGGAPQGLRAGQPMEFTVAETPRGFIVV